MKKLTLHSENDLTYIHLPVDFIDLYMPEASAEALKVYLYLLRASSDPSILLSIQDMTDLFDVTQNRVVQALRYWEDCGLLSLEEKDGEIADITLLPIPKQESSKDHAAVSASSDAKAGSKEQEASRTYTVNLSGIAKDPSDVLKKEADEPAIDLHALLSDEGFTELLSLAEVYTKKSLSPSQQNALASCYVLVGKKTDIAEYLIENCIDNGHTSFKYMEAVAKRWNAEGYTTLEEIKAASAFRNESVYSVLKALGIRRDPVASEESMILNWAKSFDLPIILEACSRTMQSLHLADFKYVSGILNRWKDAGVHSLQDIAELDVLHEDRKKADKNRPAVSNFKGIESRSTDYDKLFSGYQNA